MELNLCFPGRSSRVKVGSAKSVDVWRLIHDFFSGKMEGAKTGFESGIYRQQNESDVFDYGGLRAPLRRLLFKKQPGEFGCGAQGHFLAVLQRYYRYHSVWSWMWLSNPPRQRILPHGQSYWRHIGFERCQIVLHPIIPNHHEGETWPVSYPHKHFHF